MVELSAGASVALGVFVGLLSTSIQSVGLTLQRKSHLLEEEKEDDYERRPPYRRRRWQIGMGMFIVANIVGSTIQITTLPLPVLSTLQASGLVFNSICASLILSEPFTRYSLVGTILVAAGALLIGIFGSLSEPSHNLDQLLALLGRRQFILWMIGTAVIVIALIFGNWFLKRVYARPTPRIRLVRGMMFGCISGILSAHSLLIAKSAVELLVRTIVDRHNEFNRWQSWIILIGLIAFALSQLYYMHRGLKLCSTSVLYPLVFCIYNIIAIIDGLIYFHQSSRLSALQAGIIALGTIILLGGVFSLSWRLDEGRIVQEPQSPTMHIKHKGRVPTPQAILTPGMGLVHPDPEEEEERLVDLESALPGAHGSEHEQNLKRKRASVDEHTPLLRHTTAPAPVLPNVKKRPSLKSPTASNSSHPNRRSSIRSPKASPSPRWPAPRRRRMTISEETNEIWDELNDRDTSSLRSPVTARRSADLERRPRSGTLPSPRRKDSKWLGQLRRRSWWEGLGPSGGGSASTGKRPVGRDAADESGDDEEGESSGLLDSRQRRASRGWVFGSNGKGSEQERLGDWFHLKWWRKRWRDGEASRDEAQSGHDEEDIRPEDRA